MTYDLLAAAAVVIALVIFYLAARVLFRHSWFLAWLRGMFGLACVAIAVVLALVALDLHSYRQMTSEQHIATLSFQADGEQRFRVNLVDSGGQESDFLLSGDLWQLDARLLLWNQKAAGLGIKPGYRLERLSGRYLSLEQEQNGQRTVHELSRSHTTLDLWRWLYNYGRSIDLVTAKFGSATYMPMADGALFSVHLNAAGLIARPLNNPAQTVVERWQ